MLIKADLHIHSCLSPCASLEMSPVDIVRQAISKGLNLIAITDHNSALNSKAFSDICMQHPELHCLYGMEVCSIEEVHNLCLFESIDAVLELGEHVYKHLPDVPNNPEVFGDQIYVDKDEVIIGEVEKYLGNAINLSITQLKDFVQQAGGLFIPAHIDRAMYSMTSQLGFLPEDNYDAVEISKHYFKQIVKKEEFIKKIDHLENYQTISNSDSHYLEDIAKVYNQFEVSEVSIAAIKEKLVKREWEIVLNF